MTDKVFLVTSIIDPENIPLTYSKVRSCFTPEERFRQTIYTLNSLNFVLTDNDSIYLIDASNSPDWKRELQSSGYKFNYVSVKTEFPDIFNSIRTYPNQSYGECLLLNTFLTNYESQLSEFNYLFKISGRYFIDNSFLKEFNEAEPCYWNYNYLKARGLANPNLYFKTPLKWYWDKSWGYDFVDIRSKVGDNFLRQYITALFGWNSLGTYAIKDVLNKICYTLKDESMLHYDMETLIYFFSRQYEEHIVEINNWNVLGWNKVSGNLVRW